MPVVLLSSSLHNKTEGLFYNFFQEEAFFYLIYFITSNCYQVTGFISWFNGYTALTDKRLKKNKDPKK